MWLGAGQEAITCRSAYTEGIGLYLHIGNWNSRKTGMGTCKNSCSSLDSLPMKFIESCKPSHKYSIAFLTHNKCRSH